MGGKRKRSGVNGGPQLLHLPSPTHRDKENDAVAMVGRVGQGNSLHAPCLLNGVQCKALVDTGSTISILQPGVLPRESDGWLEGWTPTTVRLRTVTGQVASMLGRRRLEIQLGDCTIQHEL